MKLPKAYNPAEYEENIYALWEKGRAFEPKKGDTSDYYSLVLPPPNANGDLHIGHALTVAIEDALARYHRMQGKPTLYVPGADHAGFETWVVYEKKLAEQGKSRFDYSREELYKQVWDFVQDNKHNFEAQLRALGASVDWSRYTFTLDSKVVAASYETFKKMWDEGLIYRGKRIVNFCTFHGTSFSDIEVVHEEEKTKLWHIAYPLADGGGEVVIATTRPETKLGQSALMVHPNDKRYRDMIGREVLQPLVPGRPIKIIADEYVDMEFGTGVVTVTPAHDPNDFEVARRHGLPPTELITPEGKMSDQVPEQFRGLTVAEARKAVVKELEEKGLLRSVEDHVHSIGKCYKCGNPIEPLAREQWFVRMQPLAQKAITELRASKISFYPASKQAQLERYLTEVKDWNISRQIPWGIPIPAFQNIHDPSDWIFDTRVHEETLDEGLKSYRRDPDVFDTWFSSGQWPYVTLNYPDGDEFRQFYPLSLMETGGEILYQWVARMLMLGLYRTGSVPFTTVYIHGYVLAEDGAKMSKSLGNVVNPLELIKQYGSDALRMGLLTGRRAGVNQGYHPPKIINGRNFANKLWNIARYIEDKVGDEHSLRAQPEAQSPADHWILARIGSTADEIKKAMDNYRLSEAFEELYRFVWSDLADWYIEASKSAPNKSLLAYALESTLKLAHPFAPFVSEAIWQTLPTGRQALAWEQNNLLINQAWPQVPPADRSQAGQFEEVKNIVTEVRWLTTVSGQKAQKLYYHQSEGGAELVGKLARLEIAQATDNPSGVRLTSVKSEWWLDLDAVAAKEKLEARKTELQKEADSLQKRLDNQDYLAKAPPELVEQTKLQLAEAQSQAERLGQVLGSFS